MDGPAPEFAASAEQLSFAVELQRKLRRAVARRAWPRSPWRWRARFKGAHFPDEALKRVRVGRPAAPHGGVRTRRAVGRVGAGVRGER
jgi:hypothetical protein